ncbi:MAG: hypothetical protein ABL895_16790 [Cyclobacteriaceae bacterium]
MKHSNIASTNVVGSLIIVAYILALCGCEEKSQYKQPMPEYAFSDSMRRIQINKYFSKRQDFSIKERRKAAFFIKSIDNALKNTPKSTLDSNLLNVITKIPDAVKDQMKSRIKIVKELPDSVKRRFFDFEFYARNLPSISLLSQIDGIESAGSICSPTLNQTCINSSQSGKILIPGVSQSIDLDPQRPIAYVALGQSGFSLINITNPVSLTFLAENIKTPNTGFVNDIVAMRQQNNFYVVVSSDSVSGVGGAIEIFNVNNPASPSIVSTISNRYKYLTFDALSNILFSANLSNQTIDMISLSTVSTPNVISTFSINTTNISDLAYYSNNLQVLESNGQSTFYRLTDPISGSLIWAASNSYCPDSSNDTFSEIVMANSISLSGREGGHGLVEISSMLADFGFPTICSGNCFPDGSNAIYINDNVIVGDVTKRAPSCDEPSLLVYHYNPNNPCLSLQNPLSVFLRNEINSLYVRGNSIYLGDKSFGCKTDQALYFRVITIPTNVESHQGLAPTISMINGVTVSDDLNSLPNVNCGNGQTVFCTDQGQCGEGGYCNGGVCTQLPIIEVENGMTLELAGSNFWDINAEVWISNDRGANWIPFNARVYGDEYCETYDLMEIDINQTAAVSGIKLVKIRNYNTYGYRHCINCGNLDDPNCISQYYESKPYYVYFKDATNSTFGFDLKMVEIDVEHGTEGCGDLNNSWCGIIPAGHNQDDEIFILTSSPLDGIEIKTPGSVDGIFELSNPPDDKATFNTTLMMRDPNQADAALSNKLEIWENDDTGALGNGLLLIGAACLGSGFGGSDNNTGDSSGSGICSGNVYCYAACAGIAVTGIILTLVDGNEMILSESSNGLELNKLIASQILEFGDCGVPSSWSDNSHLSNNSVISVSNQSSVGGLKRRTILKKYDSKDDPPIYKVKFELTERN